MAAYHLAHSRSEKPTTSVALVNPWTSCSKEGCLGWTKAPVPELLTYLRRQTGDPSMNLNNTSIRVESVFWSRRKHAQNLRGISKSRMGKARLENVSNENKLSDLSQMLRWLYVSSHTAPIAYFGERSRRRKKQRGPLLLLRLFFFLARCVDPKNGSLFLLRWFCQPRE